jgi:hypothetical protein
MHCEALQLLSQQSWLRNDGENPAFCGVPSPFSFLSSLFKFKKKNFGTILDRSRTWHDSSLFSKFQEVSSPLPVISRCSSSLFASHLPSPVLDLSPDH